MVKTAIVGTHTQTHTRRHTQPQKHLFQACRASSSIHSWAAACFFWWHHRQETGSKQRFPHFLCLTADDTARIKPGLTDVAQIGMSVWPPFHTWSLHLQECSRSDSAPTHNSTKSMTFGSNWEDTLLHTHFLNAFKQHTQHCAFGFIEKKKPFHTSWCVPCYSFRLKVTDTSALARLKAILSSPCMFVWSDPSNHCYGQTLKPHYKNTTTQASPPTLNETLL